MSSPQHELNNLPTLEGQLIRLFLFVSILIFAGPITVLSAVFLYLKLRSQGPTVSLRFQLIAFASLIGFAVIVAPFIREPVTSIANTLASGYPALRLNLLLTLWLATLPLIPFGAVMISLAAKIHELLNGQTLERWVIEEQQTREKREATLSKLAMKREAQLPAKRQDQIRLGPIIKGDTFPANLGVSRLGNWLSLSDKLLDQHLLLVGTTGAGKSEAIKRIVQEVLSSTERDLFLVDGKGDEELAQTIRAIAYSVGKDNVPIFRLGTGKPGALYNGFCGAPQDVYSRLLALSGISDAEGNAEYYADINRDLLQLICYAPGGPPRSFEDVRARLSLEWLKMAWRSDPGELEAIREMKEPAVEGLARRLRPLIREFAPLVGPNGFCLEGTRSAVFSIRTQSVSDTAARFLSFLVEDLKDFAGKRQNRAGVLIIDEFSAFGNHNIIALLSLARSARLGIILATQDIAGLGDEATKRLILANTRTKILMASDFPEEVAKLAGTIYQVESSIQHTDGQSTGMGSARIQHTFKVDMNEAGRLQPGEGFLIRQRYAAKLRISAVKDVPAAPAEPLHSPQKTEGVQVAGPPSDISELQADIIEF